VPTIFENLVNRTGLAWYAFVALVGLALVLSAASAAYLDGVWGEFFSAGHWRELLGAPSLTVYILAIIPPLGSMGNRALAALRTLVPEEDEDFDLLVDQTAQNSPRGEWIAFGAGVAFGLLASSPAILVRGFSWIGLHVVLSNGLTFGLLAWSIYAALANGRLMAALHQQPLEVDIFDQGPFQPVGRQSLTNALAFFGGALLSLLFFSWGEEDFWAGSLFFYGLLVLISALVFYLPMRQTHRVLASAKYEELSRVQHNIVSAYRALEEFPADSPNLGILPTRLNLWKEYEARVKATRTWPFNLGMVRTFALSVLMPVAISLAQRLLTRLFSL
jgi:hypothetical protein